MKSALVTGATGLIGKQLLNLLLQDPYYTLVKAVTRKSLDISHAKLQNVVTDFDQLIMAGDVVPFRADHVFCCLGTTIRKAGTKEAFRKVDYTYPLEVACASLLAGAQKYLLVSALGADKQSSVFYNRVKGEVEEAITALDFPEVHIFRPSLLLGPREEPRPGEDAAKVFFRLFGFLVPEKYKAIDSSAVARAMLWYAKKDDAGVHIHESAALRNF